MGHGAGGAHEGVEGNVVMEKAVKNPSAPIGCVEKGSRRRGFAEKAEAERRLGKILGNCDEGLKKGGNDKRRKEELCFGGDRCEKREEEDGGEKLEKPNVNERIVREGRGDD